MSDESDMAIMLNIIRNSADSTHLLLKYIHDTYKAGKSLEYVMSTLECHIEGLDRLLGPATLEAAREMIKMTIDHMNGEHDECPM